MDKYSQNTASKIDVSIVIAARNEEQNIEACLLSIIVNEYKKDNFEIIVVDDHSTDNTKECIISLNAPNVRVLSLPELLQGKKAALSYGIAAANHPIIITTDADCIVSRHWIHSHAKAYQNDIVQMCTSVVLPEESPSILNAFQFLDMVATMATTKAGILSQQYYLANGANLSFRKEAFMKTSGYVGNEKIASGDDIFLINKIVKAYPGSIRFISDQAAIAITKPEKSWDSLWYQRIRWASKSSKTNNLTLMALQGYIFLYSCLLVIGCITSILLISASLVFSILTGILLKYTADYFFLQRLSIHYGRQFKLSYFIPSFFMYFFHIIASGIVALFPGNYKWKGRSVT